MHDDSENAWTLIACILAIGGCGAGLIIAVGAFTPVSWLIATTYALIVHFALFQPACRWLARERAAKRERAAARGASQVERMQRGNGTA